MRFLTRAWHEQQMTPDEFERVRLEFCDQVDAVAPRLPIGVALLEEAGGEHSLHDGRVASTSLQGARLTLVIRGYDWTTDLPVAPLQFVLRYDQAVPRQGSWEEILAVLSDAECEILCCELDLVGDGSFVHRMLLWPPRLGEIAITFTDASVALGPAGSREDDWED